jgi:nuclear pore complex protein Nup205
VHASQLYDMRYELNEVEARRERYPSTISYLNLVNALIREEHDLSDSGHRYSCYFSFWLFDLLFVSYAVFGVTN